MLYNFNDHPVDLYNRFLVNMEILEKKPHVKIFSFPMRYSPVTSKDRSFVGNHWEKRYIRSLQLILQATHGIVSHKSNFFYRAFGDDSECFMRLLLMPYHYIINRDTCEYGNLLIQQWNSDYKKLSNMEKHEFFEIVRHGLLKEIPRPTNRKLRNILHHYNNETAQVLTDKEIIGLSTF